jgi:hypothetical protein
MEDTVTITPTEEATGAAKPAMSKGQLVALKPPRLRESATSWKECRFPRPG